MNEPSKEGQPDAQDEVLVEKAMSLEEAMAMAIDLHRTGELDGAELVYRKILEVIPDYPNALHFLGVLLHGRGRSSEGVELIRKAIEQCPDYVDAYANLSNLLRALGRWNDAVNACCRAIEIKPDCAAAYNNLGLSLKKLRRFDEAAAAFRKVITLEPTEGIAHYNLGVLLSRQGRDDEAIEEYRLAVRQSPSIRHAYVTLGRELQSAGRLQEAIAVFREMFEREPGSPFARHMLAAYTGKDVPGQAPVGYVEQLFDVFADQFDDLLIGKLDYRGPALMAKAIAGEFGDPGVPRLDVLDAGCGTGLCGPVLKSYARRMVGVDLSVGMLNRARQRNVYDELEQAELTQFMQQRPACFDLIISSDTLVYMGELAAVVAAGASALRSGGVLIFSLEHALDGAGEEGYRLEFSGRYVHGEDYVRRMLVQAGLEIRSIRRDILRKEGGKPVAGLIAVASRP